METKSRLAIPWTGSTTSSWLPALVLAIALSAAALFVGIMLLARPVNPAGPTGGASVTQHQVAPDAAERNDIYSAALAARAHESADAVDRNAQLTYRQMLARFNDKSPDAQERNIALSGR